MKFAEFESEEEALRRISSREIVRKHQFLLAQLLTASLQRSAGPLGRGAFERT